MIHINLVFCNNDFKKVYVFICKIHWKKKSVIKTCFLLVS